MEQIIRIGIDTSKRVFQLHGVNAVEEPVLRKKLRHKEVEGLFEKLSLTVVAIEACGWIYGIRSVHITDRLAAPMR